MLIKYFIILLMSLPVIATAQFHEKVQSVTGYPKYNGTSVIEYYYIIVFTKDNWKTEEVLLKHNFLLEYGAKSDIDWKMQIGYTVKDNLEPIAYKVKAEAIRQAEKLNTYSKCRAFNDKARQERLKWKKENDRNDTQVY